MEKYLKMSGHFVGNVSINTDGQICDDKYFRGSTDIAEDYYGPICHAINSHDELVAEVERLTKSAELAIMTLEEVDRVLTERIKNGAYDLDDISGEVAYALDKISARE